MGNGNYLNSLWLDINSNAKYRDGKWFFDKKIWITSKTSIRYII